jgi:flagellar basal-body rod modification protein FlgD
VASPISALTSPSAAAASAGDSASTAVKTPNPASEEVFLKLLVEQIKNQDPLNPTDGAQFVAQLSQFSQLEQLIAIRGDLDNQKNTPPVAGTIPTSGSTQTQTNNTTGAKN